MRKARIYTPISRGGYIGTTTKHTNIPQRKTLEEAMINLATCLGVKTIHKQQSARGAYFYEPQALSAMSYQSASNTILELSRKLLEQQKGD